MCGYCFCFHFWFPFYAYLFVVLQKIIREKRDTKIYWFPPTICMFSFIGGSGGWGSKGPCPPPPLHQIGIDPFLYCFYAFGLGLEVRGQKWIQVYLSFRWTLPLPQPHNVFFFFFFFFFFWGGGGIWEIQKKMCQSPFSPPPPPIPFRAAASSWHTPPIVQTPHWD